MIHVPIILDSYGLGTNCRPLGALAIINDGTGTATRGNYTVRQFDRTGKRVVREARLENWPRQAKSPVQLLAAALKALGHDGDPK